MTTLIPKYDQGSTGAINRPFNIKLQESVSVMDFGAVGDGIADDTAAIQSALNSGAGSIYFPKGVYKITSALSVTTKMTIYGSGRDTSTIVCTGCNGIVYATGELWSNVYDLGIQQAVSYTTTPNSYIAFSVTDGTLKSENYIYKNLYIVGFGTAFQIKQMWQTTFDTVYVLNCHVGIDTLGTLCVINYITDCIFNLDGSAGSYGVIASDHIEGWHCTSTLFFNCYIGFYAISSSSIYIANCEFDFIQNKGIYGVATSADPRNQDWSITNNYFAAGGATTDSLIRFDTAYYHPANFGNRIVGNNFLIYASPATCNFGIRFTGTYCQKNSVVGNTFATGFATDAIYNGGTGYGPSVFVGNEVTGSSTAYGTSNVVDNNYVNFIGNPFATVTRGTNVTIPSGTPTYLFTSTSVSCYQITAFQSDNSANTASAIVVFQQGAGTSIFNLATTAGWALSLSGANVQLTQTSGTARACNWSAVQLY